MPPTASRRLVQSAPYVVGVCAGFAFLAASAVAAVASGAWAIGPSLAEYNARASLIEFLATLGLAFLMYVLPAVVNLAQEQAILLGAAAVLLAGLGSLAFRARAATASAHGR